MKPMGIMVMIAALLAPTLDAGAQSLPSVQQIGDAYEITKSYDTQRTSDDGSSGSSRGRDTILERVIGMREGGVELAYDLPKGATAEERADNWQFPTRVFKPSTGPMQLLNGIDLEARVDSWLKSAGWTRAVCGHWIFTWNAFRIECDPQSAIKAIEALGLPANLREGIHYQVTEARDPGILEKKATGPNGETFAVVLEIDPDAIHRARAESDVVVGEILQAPVTLEAALSERAKESVSGTISVTFVTDSTGNAERQTKVTKLATQRPDGSSISETITETIERRRVSDPAIRN